MLTSVRQSSTARHLLIRSDFCFRQERRPIGVSVGAQLVPLGLDTADGRDSRRSCICIRGPGQQGAGDGFNQTVSPPAQPTGASSSTHVAADGMSPSMWSFFFRARRAWRCSRRHTMLDYSDDSTIASMRFPVWTTGLWQAQRIAADCRRLPARILEIHGNRMHAQLVVLIGIAIGNPLPSPTSVACAASPPELNTRPICR